MNPKHWVLVKLLWPPDTDRTVLTAARRCLLRAAPVEFKDTGFQLLERHALDNMRSCVQDTLANAGLGLSEVLVILPAPAVDELTQDRYLASTDSTLESLEAELLVSADKIAGGSKLTNRLFNKSYERLDICDQFLDTPEIVSIRTLLDRLSVFPHHEQRAKGSKLVAGLAAKVVKLKEGISDE